MPFYLRHTVCSAPNFILFGTFFATAARPQHILYHKIFFICYEMKKSDISAGFPLASRLLFAPPQFDIVIVVWMRTILQQKFIGVLLRQTNADRINLRRMSRRLAIMHDGPEIHNSLSIVRRYPSSTTCEVHHHQHCNRLRLAYKSASRPNHRENLPKSP